MEPETIIGLIGLILGPSGAAFVGVRSAVLPDLVATIEKSE